MYQALKTYKGQGQRRGPGDEATIIDNDDTSMQHFIINEALASNNSVSECWLCHLHIHPIAVPEEDTMSWTSLEFHIERVGAI